VGRIRAAKFLPALTEPQSTPFRYIEGVSPSLPFRHPVTWNANRHHERASVFVVTGERKIVFCRQLNTRP
jgi:hypothetical protein